MSESRESRRHRSRSLAAFFLAGALLSAVAVVLPGWEQMHRAGIVVTVVMAASGSLLLVVWGERIGPRMRHGFTAAGTALIGACQVLAGGGSATATYGMLYIWVVLHCAMFFPRRTVAAHLSLTTTAHVGALVWLGESASMAPQLALTLGTQIAAALVVGSLVAKMRQLADTDSLTGLGNRRVLDRALAWALAHSRRRPDATTWLALLDLNGFKQFNDVHGHVAGDRLLVEAATNWQAMTRQTDTLARTGGDEFTLVLTGCDAHEAEAIVHRMTVAAPEGVSCSVGLASWDGRETPRQLIERADAALYAAKAGGPVVVAPTLIPVGVPQN